MLQGWDPSWTVRRFDAAAAIDGGGFALRHPSGISAVLERRQDGSLQLAAIGPADQIASSSRWAGVGSTAKPDCLLIPGLVNAHTHLDLTHIGPRQFDPSTPGGFTAWVDMIRQKRLSFPAEIAASVRRGVDLSLTGGTVLVGDIAGAVGGKASAEPGRALVAEGRLNGVSYVEFFAQGAHAGRSVLAARDVWRAVASLNGGGAGRIIVGIHPHAPYSVGKEYYSAVLALLPKGTPACTHLAESAQEHEFIASATGPFRTLLEKIGVWDQQVGLLIGRGRSPIDHLSTVLLDGVVPVHCNDVSDVDLMALCDIRSPIIYCPRSSTYFAAERSFGPHRYRDMLAAGLTVALGTDSIVNLDTPERISVWDEVRFLHQRDGTEPMTLLKMATLNGAQALKRDPQPFQFSSLGTLAGLVAIPVPGANPHANASELLKQAMIGGLKEIPSDSRTIELLAIGRV